MAIAAADVKKLRDATGAGMMDAKKALTETDGDFDKAIEVLRVTGQAKAAKRADREASNGLVANSGNALIQLGAETDFVAKNTDFVELSELVAQAVNEAKADGVEAAKAVKLEDGRTVEAAIAELAVKIGEKLELTNAAYFDGETSVYLHRRASDLPPQVGVLLEATGGNAEVLRAVAMQIAAMRPAYVNRDEVPSDIVDNEKRIAEATAKEQNKPEQAVPRIVEGRVNGFFKEVCLLDQPSVSEDKKTVGQQLEAVGASVKRFVRFEAGA